MMRSGKAYGPWVPGSLDSSDRNACKRFALKPRRCAVCRAEMQQAQEYTAFRLPIACNLDASPGRRRPVAGGYRRNEVAPRLARGPDGAPFDLTTKRRFILREQEVVGSNPATSTFRDPHGWRVLAIRSQKTETADRSQDCRSIANLPGSVHSPEAMCESGSWCGLRLVQGLG